MKRVKISSGSEFESKAAYSRAVVDGDYIFISGTTGYNYETMEIEDDISVQTNQCFININKVLVEAGSSIEDIVRVQYILPNRDDFKDCWPVLNKWLGEVRPAATMFEARLLNDAMKIEIEVTAKISKD